METETTKSFRSGFTLTEQELRRIVGMVTQQIKKVSGDREPHLEFTVKYQGGAITQAGSLDDILTQGNIGSTAVVRLTFKASDLIENPLHTVRVEFADPDRNDSDWLSMHFAILGQDRDWVLVAGSELEERIRRVRNISWTHVMKSRTGSSVMMMAATIGVIVSMIVAASVFDFPSRNYITDVEQAWLSGELTDAIEAAIRLERGRTESSSPASGWWIFIAPLFLLLIVVVAQTLIPRLAASYHFVWGDYIASYNRRKNLWIGF